jgi:AraC-like DNA-binding protein/mannose-6-phosphate isomerase-like protein (cupin superfamily)
MSKIKSKKSTTRRLGVSYFRLKYNEIESEKINQDIFDSLQITAVSAVKWICFKDWAIHDRVVHDGMIYCMEKGSCYCELIEEKKSCTIHPGDIFIIPRGTRHSIYPDQGKDVTLFTMHFTAEIYNTHDFMTLFGLGGKFSSGDNLDFLKLSEIMAKEFTLQRPGWDLLAASAMSEIITGVARRCAEPGDYSHSEFHHEIERITPALELISQQLSNAELKIESLAEITNMSLTNFRRIFKRAVGTSPIDFIRRKRISTSCRMLKKTSHEIKKIAIDCGFSEVTFFYRVFKKITGFTPAEYRKSLFI